MSGNANNLCPYHTQDEKNFCGAACAMMVLSHLGIATSGLDQQTLFASNHSHNSSLGAGWATAPFGLKWTLNHLPSPVTSFNVFKPATEAAGTREIVTALATGAAPPSVLVLGDMHWVVVRGVQNDVDPTGPGPYTVEGLFINNPVFYPDPSQQQQPPPPPHAVGDVCGSGTPHGYVNSFIPYPSWQLNWFTGAHYNSGTPLQYIRVSNHVSNAAIGAPASGLIGGAPQEGPTGTPGAGAPQGQDGRPPSQRPDAPLSPEAAGKACLDAIRAYGVDVDSPRLDLGHVEPRPVVRIDAPEKAYYLVVLERYSRPAALAGVEAMSGALQSVDQFTPREQPFLVSAESAVDFLYGRQLPGKRGRGRTKLHADKIEVSHTLVWKPCPESFSPQLPFHRVRAGDRGFYLRVDGAIFPELTEGERGG